MQIQYGRNSSLFSSCIHVSIVNMSNIQICTGDYTQIVQYNEIIDRQGPERMSNIKGNLIIRIRLQPVLDAAEQLIIFQQFFVVHAITRQNGPGGNRPGKRLSVQSPGKDLVDGLRRPPQLFPRHIPAAGRIQLTEQKLLFLCVPRSKILVKFKPGRLDRTYNKYHIRPES